MYCLRIVLDILRARCAPLQRCRFKIDFFDARNINFNRAFRLLRKHALQELLLLNLEGDPSKVPPGTFFLSQTLQKLEVVNCNVILPPQFEVFSNLRTLRLVGVLVTEESFERLVSGCPALEDLRLRELLQPTFLRIRAPKLQSMEIQMYRAFHISLVDTPCLRNVTLSYSFDLAKGTSFRFYLDRPTSVYNLYSMDPYLSDEEDEKEKDEVGKLIDLLMNSSNLESLSLRCSKEFFKYSMKPLPAPLQLVHLKKLFMKLTCDDAIVINLLLFLLRSSPNLQELDLQGTSYKKIKEDSVEFDCWDTQRAPECFVNHLTMVQIRDVPLSSKNLIGFARFILLNACVLKTMKLHHYTKDQLKEKVVDELLLLKKASPQVVLKVRHFKPYCLWDSD